MERYEIEDRDRANKYIALQVDWNCGKITDKKFRLSAQKIGYIEEARRETKIGKTEPLTYEDIQEIYGLVK